jgi:Zn-dependent protease with chaperone function
MRRGSNLATKSVDPTVFFTPDEVARARAYHRPLYVALAVDVFLTTLVTAWLAFGWLGDRVYDATGGPWWARTLVFTVLVLAILELVRLPLSFWRGFLRERRWGFSTQTSQAWALDRVKGFAIGAVLTSAVMIALLGSIHVFPSWWPLVSVVGACLLVLLLVFVAPVVLEPVFNRFEPLQDRELAGALRALADRAGVPVREVLVADASRRTRKQNAYVSGIGNTRRVVVFDTLLDEAGQPELEVVVAHELGHRRHRDVAKGTLLAMASATVAVLVVWPLDPTPRNVPLLLFVWGLLEVAALPFTAAFSRRLERQADRFALDITHDPSAFEAAFRRMAKANLADLDPPRLAYTFVFTHPTPVERLATVAS